MTSTLEGLLRFKCHNIRQRSNTSGTNEVFGQWQPLLLLLVLPVTINVLKYHHKGCPNKLGHMYKCAIQNVPSMLSKRKRDSYLLIWVNL